MVALATAVEFDPNAVAAAILPAVHRYARRYARGNRELAEVLENAATDAVLWAVRKHHYGIEPLAWRMVRRRVRDRRAAWLAEYARRPRFERAEFRLESVAAPAATAERPNLRLDTIRTLPPELLEPLRLYFLDGLTLRECGARLGIDYTTVHRRLKTAASRLGGKLPKRSARRMKRG